MGGATRSASRRLGFACAWSASVTQRLHAPGAVDRGCAGQRVDGGCLVVVSQLERALRTRRTTRATHAASCVLCAINSRMTYMRLPKWRHRAWVATRRGQTPLPREPTVRVAPTANVALVGGADWLILEVIQPANPWQGRDIGKTLEPDTSDTSDTSNTRCAGRSRTSSHCLHVCAAGVRCCRQPVSHGRRDGGRRRYGARGWRRRSQEPPFSGLLRLAVAHESPLVSSGGMTDALGASATSSGSRDEAFRMRDTVVGGR